MSIGIAVIGCGVWGKQHVRVLRELGVLRAVHDSNPDAIWGIVDLQEIWNDPEIQGVVIATPPKTHYKLAGISGMNGKSVLVEKPMTTTEGDARIIRNSFSNSGCILMVGHLMLYHPGFVRLKEIVDSGEIGKVEYVYTNRLQPGRIRTEENSLWSLAPHDISMIVALCGMPTAVSCTGSPLRGEQADITMATMQFGDRVRGHVFVSWLHPGKSRLLYVVGSMGSAWFVDDGIDWSVNSNSSSGYNYDCGVEPNPLRTELEHFIHCIDTGEKPLTDGAEGDRVVRVLAACQRSMDSNGERITL